MRGSQPFARKEDKVVQKELKGKAGFLHKDDKGKGFYEKQKLIYQWAWGRQTDGGVPTSVFSGWSLTNVVLCEPRNLDSSTKR